MRRYAEDTSVPVGRSRGQIDDLLRDWGARGVQWTDDYHEGRVALRFVWKFEGSDYMARFDVMVPTAEDVAREYSRRPTDKQLSELAQQRNRQAHRVLLLWLKAALNAVTAGIITAEALFLPFLEGKNGRTVAEEALPKLSELLAHNAGRLLPQHGSK